MSDGVRFPTLDRFDTGPARELLNSLDRLTTFADVLVWDQHATEHLTKITEHLDRTAEFLRLLERTETEAEDLHARRPFFTRLFSSTQHIREIIRDRQKLRSDQEELSALSEELQAAIDKTPNSREEKQEMLKELKLLKKELGIRKRELNEAMRQIRTVARQGTARVGAGVGLFLSTPTTRRLQRMSIRLEKESALASHEDSRVGLERQILVVERAIHWAERIK